jgi:hypothetical protein
MPASTDLAISGLEPPADGEANETFLFTATWNESGVARNEDLVVRLSPQGPPFFLGSNLRFQWDVMETVAAAPDVQAKNNNMTTNMLAAGIKVDPDDSHMLARLEYGLVTPEQTRARERFVVEVA